MPYIGKSPLTGNYNKLDSITGSFNSSTTAFNLTVGSNALTPVRAETLLVSLNGVIQQAATDYTVSGTQITFTTAPASSDTCFIIAFGEKLDIGTPSDATVTSAKLSGNLVTPGTLDVNGAELILDADADTSITADTDDTIDIKIAGADDFQFTANTMSVLSGSTLNIDSGATIANSGTATGFAATGVTPASVQVFTSSGTWTRPTDILTIVVTVVGGGGGGAGGTEGGGDGVSGGGGGGGGYAIEMIDVTSLSSETVTIGASGAGGSSNSAGSDGGTSSFGSYCSATGGGGGLTGSNTAYNGRGGQGGVGTGGNVQNGHGGPGSPYLRTWWTAGYPEGSCTGGSTYLSQQSGANTTHVYGCGGNGQTGSGGSGSDDNDGAVGAIIVWEYK